MSNDECFFLIDIHLVFPSLLAELLEKTIAFLGGIQNSIAVQPAIEYVVYPALIFLRDILPMISITFKK